jgi:hypothetical protein
MSSSTFDRNKSLELVMKNLESLSTKLIPALALLVGLGIVAPGIDAEAEPEFGRSWRVLQTYGGALVWKVFNPESRAPDFWLAGENLEFLARLPPAERQAWRPRTRNLPQGGVPFVPTEDPLMIALFDLCSGAVHDSSEARGVEQVGVFEDHLFRWTRTAVRSFFDPVTRWMSRDGIAEHPGTTGDMICRMVLKRDFRLRWPETMTTNEFGPSMSPRKLLLALGHDEETIRTAALEEIAKRGGSGAELALFTGLLDGKPKVRYGAAVILEHLAEKRWGAAGSSQ